MSSHHLNVPGAQWAPGWVPRRGRPRRRPGKLDQPQRLLRLLDLLSRKQRFSVNDTADRFFVRRETIYRDLRRLKALGYPLEATDFAGDPLYQFSEAWPDHCPALVVSRAEVEAAILAIQQYCRLGAPDRLTASAISKLEALHSHSGPPSHVRMWQSLLENAEDLPKAPSPNAVLLLDAIAKQHWCDLSYIAMGQIDPRSLSFAPYQVSASRLFGRPRDHAELEALDLDRIRNVAITDDRFERDLGLESQLEPGAQNGDSLPRADGQMLRLLGIIQMFASGKAPNATELAALFSTTLTTIRRDLRIIEESGFATTDSGGGRRRFEANPICFGAVPALPLAQPERVRLAHILSRFMVHYPSSGVLADFLRKLNGAVGDLPAVLTMAEGMQPSNKHREPFLALVDAIQSRRCCLIVYDGHWGYCTREFQLIPESIVVDAVLRVKGEIPGCGRVSLQLCRILSVTATNQFPS